MSYLLAKDTVNGAEGKIFVTIDGKNMEVACMRNITTNAEIQSNDMRVIGTRTIQNKNNGADILPSHRNHSGTLCGKNSPRWSTSISTSASHLIAVVLIHSPLFHIKQKAAF